MIKPHSFTNIGSRNKGVMWEYLSACAYRDLDVIGSKYRLSKLLSFGEKESNQHCLGIDEIALNTKLIIEESEAGIYTESFFENLIKSYQEPLTHFKKFVSGKSPKRLSNSELAGIFDMFHDAAARTYPPMLIGFFAAYLDDYFTDALKKVIPADGVGFITTKTALLTMPRMSFTEREDDALSALVRYIRNDSSLKSILSAKDVLSNKIIAKKIDELVQTYGWFHMEYAGLPATKEHYADMLEKRLLPDVPDMDPRKAKQEIVRLQADFFAKHDDEKLKHISWLMQELSFVLDDSKVVTIENHYLVYPFFKEIARRISMSVEDLYYLSGPEIKDALQNGTAYGVEIALRKKYRVVFLHGKDIEVFSGDKAKEVAEKYIEILKVHSTTEIKGLVAYPGIYKGKVSVVLNPNDYSKFKDGDVLVTRDGSAEFTYFLQHAGAIITDQGGIISHVAIVARESKTPAILSTKIATKVLKDGDMVEVDAEKGIVRIIK